MLEKIELNAVYTNRDDAEFIFTTKHFCTLHLRGSRDVRFDHIPAIAYMEHEEESICIMPVELFKEQFILCTDEENYLSKETK